MKGFIDGIDFSKLAAEKYWSFAKSYKGDKQAETKLMIKSGSYLGSIKKDGHYDRLIKDEDGNIILQGRTESVKGGYLDKHEWVPQCQEFFNSLPNGTCLIGELFFPNQRGSRKVTTILGCLKEKALERQKNGEKLSYYVFDVWAYNGKSYLNTTIENRIETLKKINSNFEHIEIAQYFDGIELWDLLGRSLNSGEEGIVITKKGTCPEPGKRTSRKTLKVKLEIEQTIDAFVDGDYKPATKLYSGKEIEKWNYWQNEKTGEKYCESKYNQYISGEPFEPITKGHYYGWASAISFSVMRDGKPTRIAWISGIPDEIKKNIVEQPSVLKNKVAELTCMEVENIGDAYSLRHGRIEKWREDKSFTECDFSQIV